MYIESTKHIRIKWLITGFENYAFGEDKKLYNVIRGKEVIQKVNGGSIGWWLGRKFLTKDKIMPLITKQNDFNAPF